jgi:hypothetical protein
MDRALGMNPAQSREESQMPQAVQKIVTISFTWIDTGTQIWSFAPQPLDLPGLAGGAGYCLSLVLSADSQAGALLSGFQWTAVPGPPPALPSDWTMPPPESGTIHQGVFNDNALPGQSLSFNYTVSVAFGGLTYTSPDPELLLQPPS